MCVILASGFGETGRAGRVVQAELAAIARATGMRIVGPNCMGVVNVPGRLNASYFWDVPRQPGGISFVSQSGAYGGLFFREVRARSLGVAKFVSIGNQADLGFAECLDWLADDPDTRVVGLFVEGIRDGRAFVAAARRLAAAKPVVALKGGRAERRAGGRPAPTPARSRAPGRRTAPRSRRPASWSWTRPRSSSTRSVTLEAHGSRPPRDEAVAILTDLGRALGRRGGRGGGGGPRVPGAAGGAAPGAAGPSAGVRRRRQSGRHDAPDGARGFGPSVRLVLEAPEVAGAIAIDIGLDRPGVRATRSRRRRRRPASRWSRAPSTRRRWTAGSARAGIPLVPGPERAVRAYRALVRRASRHRRAASPPPARRAPPACRPRSRTRCARRGGPLAHADGARAPRGLRVRVPARADRRRRARRPWRRGARSATLGGQDGAPGRASTGRTRAASILDVADEEGADSGGARARGRVGPGARSWSRRRWRRGLELLVGGRRDPSFGPTVLVGLGGVLAELLRDVSVGLAPPRSRRRRARCWSRGGGPARPAGLPRRRRPSTSTRWPAASSAVGDLLAEHPEASWSWTSTR